MSSNRVLIVDDEPSNLELVRRTLRHDFEVVLCSSLHDAVERMEQQRFAVVFSDYRLSGSLGTELLAHAWRVQPGAKRVLMTAYAEADALVDAINLGHVDYFLAKPFEPASLLAKAKSLSHQFAQKQTTTPGNERERTLEVSLRERERELLTVVEQLEKRNALLREASLHDGLTGLINHRSFQERLQQEIARAKRDKTHVSVLMCSVDHFSYFNEMNTHSEGDALLRRVSAFLGGQHPGDPPARATDVLSRYGADTFAVILPGTDKPGASVRAEQLCEGFRRVDYKGNAVLPHGRLHMSFGAASFPADCTSAAELIRCSEQALERAKEEGRDRVATWSATAADVPVVHRNRQVLLAKLAPVLRRSQILCNITFQLSYLSRLDRGLGVSVPVHHVHLFERIALAATSSANLLGEMEVVALLSERPGGLQLFLRPTAGHERLAHATLEGISSRFAEHIEQALRTELGTHDGSGVLRVVSSFAAELYRDRVSVEEQVERLCSSAQTMIRPAIDARRTRDRLELQSIILGANIQTYAQPLFGGHPRQCIGYEMLTRGPGQGWFRSPATLLDLADDVGLTPELDLCLLRQNLRAAQRLPGGPLLFLNVLPTTLSDTNFLNHELRSLLEELAIPARRLVLEISERQSVEDPAPLLAGLEQLRTMGIALALDDLGTRHANLSEIATFKPDWLKLDRSLVHGLHGDSVKRHLIRAVVDFGRSQGAHVLAEGIENPADLESLEGLSVRYFQGYLMGRPEPIDDIVRARSAGPLASREDEALPTLLRLPH